ncbi:hypothetical protein TNCV_1835801 [Trichonephila clavipes]|nr:hypothetical protein TNCV_1835801 [Trichonephila clavipes]
MGCVTPDWGGVDQSGSEFASVSAFCESVYAIPAGPVREEMGDLFFLKPSSFGHVPKDVPHAPRPWDREK